MVALACDGASGDQGPPFIFVIAYSESRLKEGARTLRCVAFMNSDRACGHQINCAAGFDSG